MLQMPADPESHFVVQATDYYPFGLEIQEITASDNLQLYNAKELQTDAKLWWYDYGARFYDPVLGRWHSVDCHGGSWVGADRVNFPLSLSFFRIILHLQISFEMKHHQFITVYVE